uniref:Copia protein n=1 Tax=Cacopsylla melanoneura TaxID=428564 RepID=A0A8D8ZJ24_9HEMI
MDSDPEIVRSRIMRDRRRLKMPVRFNDYDLNTDQETGFFHNVMNNHEMSSEPVSYDEVMKLPTEERQKWHDAMDVEMQALIENRTWTEVLRPENTKVITCKWVFKEKSDGDMSIYKARLVARGFEQDEKFNFEDTYAPVAKLQTLRILLAVSVHKGMEIHQMDVVCAFLNGNIDEIVYMEKPNGFQSDTNTVLRLKKSLYGLKKSPKYWNVKLNDFLIEQGFKRSENDLCLYVKGSTYILIYVDDILLISKCENEINGLKDKFKNTFKMKDLGIVSKYLGMQIVRKGNTVKINQTDYIKSVLKKFNMDKCKPVSVPIDPNFTYSGEADPRYETMCRSLIGALLYVSLCSRPDIMVSVSILARNQHIANENLWIALKRVLRYLQGTVDLSLEFPVDKNPEIDLEAYADADWAGDTATRKSTSGYIIKLFGCLVLWQSRRQSSVSLSTAEAEYISASEACSDIIWTVYILNDLGIDVKKPITLHEDNQAAIKLTAGQSKRSKHIDIRFHFIRNKVEEGLIELKYVDSNNQLADILTKPLPYPKLMGFRNKLGVK